MATKTTKRPGRPTKPARQGEKTTLSLRVDSELKQRLEDAGSSSGRNLSDEASRRLEGSFQAQDMLYQALDIALGRDGAAVVQLLARALADVGHGASFASTRRSGNENWLTDPYVYNQIVTAIVAVLEAMRPEDDATPPPSPAWAPDVAQKLHTLGTYGANRLLKAVVGRGEDSRPQAGDVNERDSPIAQWAAPVRERLGPVVVDRIRKNIARLPEGSQNG
jgi:hypothetical protein